MEKSDCSGLLLSCPGYGASSCHGAIKGGWRISRGRYVHEEKQSLREQIISLYSDKMAYALRRCADEISGAGVSPLGNQEDIEEIDAGRLAIARDLLREGKIPFYFSGHISAGDVIAVSRQIRFGLKRLEGQKKRINTGLRLLWPIRTLCGIYLSVVRSNKANSFTALNYPVAQDLRSYVALLVLNALLGEITSFLYRYLREDKRLCYFIESQVEPLLGRAYVLASVEREDYQSALKEINRGIDDLKAGRVMPEEWNRTLVLVGHRLAALRDDRDALQRMNIRSLVSGFSITFGRWNTTLLHYDSRK